ncbi:MAG: hypothetical protein ACK4MV_16830 [Beijerinckiaceae bacterium]
MSDTNFRPASSTGYGAGSRSASDLSPQHPRGSGMSYKAERRSGGRRGPGQDSYMEQASDMADDAWRTGRRYYEKGSRRVSEWANEHPNQLWAAIAVAGAFALWMGYRPVFSGHARANFDPSRYRYRRLPRPAGRADFMESGVTRGDRQGRAM